MSYQTVTNSNAPATPTNGKTVSYVDTSGRRHDINSTGVDNILAGRELPNILRNAGFWFARRQNPASATTYSNTSGRAFTADDWAVTNENASVTYQRIDTDAAPETGLQERFYGQFLKITSTGKFIVSQAIESRSAQKYRGRTVRFQAWIKATTAMTVKMAVVQLNSAGTVDTIPATFISAFGANTVDPTLGTNLAYLAPKSGVTPDNATVDTNSVKCSATTSWQRFGFVVDVPTTAKNLVVMLWTDSQPTATNGFNVAQASLTDGFEIQDWTPYPIELELLRCQRYYHKTFALDTAPAQSAGTTTGALVCIAGKAGATALAGVWNVRFPVELRSVPTITLFNPAAANAQARRVSGAAAADQTATAAANANTQSCDITCTGDASGTVGDQIQVHATFDSGF